MKKIKNYYNLIAGSVIVAVLVPAFALAQGLKNTLGNLQNVAGPAGVAESGDVGSIVGTIINSALTLVGLIFLVLMVYAGFLWMTARGEEEQINKAKKIITGTIIGLIITVSAYAITVFVTGRFGAV